MPRRSVFRARALVIAVTVSMSATALSVLPVNAFAAGTVLFNNTFADRSVDGVGTVTVPAPTSGTNVACLTASGNTTTPPLLSCASPPDTQGGGKLRLTSATANQVGGVFGAGSFPTSNGLDVTFNSYQWGGGSADGIAFMLAAVDPANPAAPTSIGPSGGSLGYSPAGSLKGVPNAYLGVGLDVFGNFSSSGFSGTGCTNPANFGTAVAGAVVVRGPGNALAGYCGLATTYAGTVASKTVLRAATRSASVVPVQVLINPTAASFTSDTGVSVAAGTYKVVVTPVGQAVRTLSGALPTVAAGLYPSTSWLSAAGVPKQLAFGFVGSTGSVTDVHEISNARVLTFNPVPQLAVSSTGYAAATSQPGDPVTYKLATSVLAGADETGPVSVTQTMPAGVLPVGAYGTGWVCQARSGQSITCTTSASSFPNGTALPALTFVGIVTTAGVTSATVQTGSSARVASTDASPGADSTTSAGTLPATPAGVTATPSIGPVTGGGAVTISGTNITAATAIEIGTAAEQQAGTPVVLLPCPGAAAAGCFTVSGGNLVISSMPARATAAPVSITVVTSGVASAASYVYASKPATPAAPVATAGITSASVTWAAPAANGSPITGYTVATYLGGVPTLSVFDASATTRVISGLTAGSSYTFVVYASNAYGTSAPSAASNAVIPYTLPGSPAITAVSAGTQSATLSWTAPASNGGSVITGYVVTPYIAGVAQAQQVFTGAATTRTLTGLTAGTAYTFVVAAQNAAGTGPSSAQSAAVTPNVSPSLNFAAPPAGEVGVAYSRQLTVAGGTAPFTWSVVSGALPAGVTLNASTGLLSGTPTTGGTYAFTVQVLDASAQTATKAVTLVIAATPVLTFGPAAGEVGVAYSTQPVVTGGTAPFAWTVSAGSLPAGLALNASTGLITGTPTAAGSYSLTLAATDTFGQVASKTAALVIVARPAFSVTPPPSGQVGVAYSTQFDVTGGALPLTWSITAGSLPPGLTLNTATGVVSGTPSVAGSSPFTISVSDANGQTASKAVTLAVTAGPLVITKSANTSSATVGSVVAYTITVANTGSANWTGATLSDPLTGVLDDAVYPGNATATAGTVTYTAPALGWTGDIPAGGTVTITYSVTVNNPVTGNRILANTVTSSTLGTNCAAGSADARCSATVTVPGLTIVKTADVATTNPGGVVRFSIVVTNSGQTPYTGATLTDSLAAVLDDATYRADGFATSGNVTYSSPSLTWTGNLAVGASATITYSVTVNEPDTGNRILTGTVVSPTAGSPCPGGNPAPSCTATVTVLVPALSIATTVSAATTTPGAVVTYTTTLSNTGQTAYTGISVNLALAGVLDDATYNNSTATAGSVVVTTPTVVWSGSLAIGAVVTVTTSVTVNNPDLGNKTLGTATTSAAAGSTCPAGGTSPACFTTVQVLIPALAITKSANTATTTPGAVVTYTISVTNSGQTPYTAATFSDSLAGVLDDATYNADVAAGSGTASFNGTDIGWTGDLAIGATATISYSVTVNRPDTGNRVLTGTITSPTPGSSCPAGGTDPRCTNTVTVLIPGVNLTITADGATTTPGSVVRYTVTVVNTGQTAYSGLDVTLDIAGALDDASYNYDAVITRGNLVTHPDATVSWVLDLAPGATATGTLSVTVGNPPGGDKILHTDVVSDSAGSTCPTGAVIAACRTAVTVLQPGLLITKTAGASTATPGDVVAYTVSVVNTGETTYAPASFSDDLGTVLTDAVYAGGATASTGTVSFDTGVLSWSGPLAPGASATIGYSITVRDPDPGDKRMYNTVVSPVQGNNCPAGGTDPRCTAVVDVLVPGLTIVKTANVPTTVPGAVVGYTITVTNSGATDQNGVTFGDSLAGVLDDATYSADAAASTGTVGFAGSTLTWTGNLAVGATATITYSVTVHSADIGDDLLTGAVTSNARGTDCAPGSTDPRCAVTVPVARLILTQSADETTVTPGSVTHVTATYRNTGQVAYTAISVVSPRADTQDDTVPAGDQATTSGTLVRTASALTWTGDIPIGGVVTVTRTLTVKNPDTGNKVITAVLSTTGVGSNCAAGSSDSRCVFLVTVLVPELTIVKTASTTTVVPGGSVGYTITIHNTGQAPYTAASLSDSMAGVLDDAGYNADATASIGTVSFASPILSWTGDLAVGATSTITYSVTARVPATGDKAMINPVSSDTPGSTCSPASGNTACRSSVVVLTPSLSITKTADHASATLGTTVTYQVKVTDTGQTPYPAAAFTDSLAGALDDAAYNPASLTATSGSAGYASGVVSWTGSLAPGGSATITYTVTIANPDVGDHSMVNTVETANPGGNCLSGSTDTRCTATVLITDSVSLTFTKTADVLATVAGATVHYTVTVVNSDAAPIGSADFTDPLAGILDDATYNGDAAVDSGTVVYTAPNLDWSGAVPAGGTITLTYSVTVHATATGDQLLTGTVSSTSVAESDNCVSGSTDPRCTNTVQVAALLLQQSYTELSTTPGSLVHLTATFTNTGKMPYVGITVASSSADTVDDAIPTGDQIATSGTLILGASAITWAGSIPVGGTVTITGTVTVKNPDPGNRIITGSLVSTALGGNCPSGSGDTRCTALLPVLLPGLTISKTADTTTALLGQVVTYTVTVHNSGETPYQGATFTDKMTGVLDDASYDADVSSTVGVAVFTSPEMRWTGDLAVGVTATVRYSVTVRDPSAGDRVLANLISSDTVGSTCPVSSGAAACSSSVAILVAAMTITSAADVATAVPGTRVTYTLTATNTGQLAYPAAEFSVSLADVLDDAAYGGDVSASTGGAVVTGQTLTWSGILGIGAVSTVTYSVLVGAPAAGNFRLLQTVISGSQGSTCPVAGADSRCTTSVAVAGLRIVNAANVSTTKPTGTVAYTVTFTNIGQVPYAGIGIINNLTGVVDDAVYNGDAAVTAGNLAALSGTQLAWTGDLAIGATVTVTGSVTVANPDLGDKVLRSDITTDADAANCPSAACATSVSVLTPALTIVKVSDTVTTTPGSVVGYTITVTNSGESPYTAAKVEDRLAGVLGDGTYSGGATASRGVVTFGGTTLTWIGDLAVGESATIGYGLRVDDPDLGDRSMVNRVVSDELGSTCATGNTNDACVNVVTVLTPVLDIAVTADSTTSTPGSAVGYTVTIRNIGETAYVGAHVTALLAGVLDDAVYTGGAATSGAVTFEAPALTWVGDLAIGATTVITYGVTIVTPDPGDRQLRTSVASAEPGSTCGTATQCSNVVTVLIPGLAISTTADVATTTPGSRVGFTVTIENTGQTPYSGLTVTTALSGLLDDAGFDGRIVASAGVASYTAPDVTWTGDLATGSSVTLTFAVSVHDPDTGDKSLSAGVSAEAPGSTCPAAGPSPSCTATVTVLIPGLSVGKSVSAPTTTPGGVVGYTIVVTNTGQTPYTGVSVSDSLAGVLPDADYNSDAVVVGGGAVTYDGSVLGWTGDLLIGASATIRYSITVHSPDTGDKLIVNGVTSGAPGSTCPAGGGPACSTLVRVLVPALVTTLTADTSAVAAGSAVGYTVTLVNTGETAYAPASFTDSLAGVLDDATYAGGAVASTGSLDYTGTTLTWTGALGVGETATIGYSVTTRFPATGDLALQNSLRSPSPGATCVTGTEAGCATTVTVLVPALDVTKIADTGQAVAGGTVHYTLSATNSGESDYPAVTLADSLAGVLDDATYLGDASASQGTVGYADGTLTWSGALPKGTNVVIGYSVTVHVDDLGDAVLLNRVVSPAVGSTCAADSVDSRCVTSVAVAARSITLNGITGSFTLTGPPHSTVGSDGVVTMTVTTNSSGGYLVTVAGTTGALVGADPGNTSTIPLDQVGVRESGGEQFGPLTNGTGLVVHRQSGPSAPGGDAVSTDYRVSIPFVPPDVYSATLEYIVSAQ